MRLEVELALGGLMGSMALLRETLLSALLGAVHARVKGLTEALSGSLAELSLAAASLIHTEDVLSQALNLLLMAEATLLNDLSLTLQGLLMLSLQLLNALLAAPSLLGSLDAGVSVSRASSLTQDLLTLFLSLGETLLNLLAGGSGLVLAGLEALADLLEVAECLVGLLGALLGVAVHISQFYSEGDCRLLGQKFSQVLHY